MYRYKTGAALAADLKIAAHGERPCRELSALTDGDFATPAVIRRATTQLGRDLATSTGHSEWSEIPDDIRADVKALMVDLLDKRLGDARIQAAAQASHFGGVRLPLAERIGRLERAVDVARRLA